MAELTREEARQEIQQLVESAYASINLAVALADEHTIEFDFSVAYGMGGYYYPEGSDGARYDGSGWQSSSSSC